MNLNIHQNVSGVAVNLMWIKFLLSLHCCQTAMSHSQLWLVTEK